ncbi:hypothetical protein [Henriciella marina]|uniref:Secreted protein n=1 Tax=Henriciella marina TaxID=453851 RepID=A0ABT4LYA6_9PROT|nr:hypothetical protein [Henriciella marina]MCZ4298124.1 hypothetical protein [Henriciella marina]
MSVTLIILFCLGGVLLVAVVNAAWAAERRVPQPASSGVTKTLSTATETKPTTPARMPAMSVDEPVLTHPSTPLPVHLSETLEAEHSPIAAAAQVTTFESEAGQFTYVQYTEIMVVRRRG